ncbi:MAG: glycosyltransferase [Thermodesulfobacteriota bacterium]|nr:glycosyltransferase [Thermodesulfobacteriota bacterium]
MQPMKADLHVHSRFSTRPSYWVLQKLGCAESYIDPVSIYDYARRKGMRFVTITDHNTIKGSLEIAHLPDTFISEEVTTYFPDTGCKIHVLALNITEAQHADIARLRENIYDLIPYLKEKSILHIVAHPLFAVNDRMTADHFEQLLLMFKHFELNGTRDGYQNDILTDILSRLTPESIEQLANKHDLAPVGDKPWQKNLTAGSDDHSGFHVASSYTLVEAEGDLNDFLAAIENRKNCVCGNASHPRVLAHTLYSIAYQFYNTKFGINQLKDSDSFFGFVDKILHLPGHKSDAVTDRIKVAKPTGDTADNGLGNQSKFLSNFCLQTARDVLQRVPAFARITSNDFFAAHEKVSMCYRFVDQAADEILARLCNTTMEKLSSGNIFDVFQMIGGGGALYAMLSPYFVAYSTFTKDRLFCRKMQAQMRSDSKTIKKPLRIGHFTDTLYDINGVAKTLRQQGEIAAQLNKHLTLITCGPSENHYGFQAFEPIDTFEMPEYPEIRLFYPPLLKILDYCYEQEFNRIHIATPGPVGLAALAIANILQLPTYGTYHTALPQYVAQLTEDSGLGDLMWKYMIWFYDQLDVIMVPSRATGDELVERGLSRDKIRFYPRGVDTGTYTPQKRNGFYKTNFDLDDNVQKLLYVGRVSQEKNMHQLVNIFNAVSDAFPGVHLIVVGDGPYMAEMKAALAGRPVVFTGYLEGDDLSEAYAGSDIFIFPSTTDTFGNVVLEAQASGVPVIVTDKGGPGENVIDQETGFIVPADDISAFIARINELLLDPDKLAAMKHNARQYMETRSFEAAFNTMWDMYREPLARLNSAKAHFFD